MKKKTTGMREEGNLRTSGTDILERITGEDHVTGVDFMNVKSFTFDENRRAIIEKERRKRTPY